MRRRLLAATLSVAVLGSVTVTAAAQEPTSQTITTLDHATPVAGYGKWLAWSTFHEGQFELTIWNADTRTTSTPPIPAQRVPFDVDLGPDERNRPTAVYSRCEAPPYTSGQVDGCDIYRLRLRGGSERRVPVAATKRYREFLPTIWRDQLTFARLPRTWRTIDDAAQIRTTRLTSRQTERIRGGSTESGIGPTDIDSYGRRVIFQWPTNPETCT